MASGGRMVGRVGRVAEVCYRTGGSPVANRTGLRVKSKINSIRRAGLRGLSWMRRKVCRKMLTRYDLRHTISAVVRQVAVDRPGGQAAGCDRIFSSSPTREVDDGRPAVLKRRGFDASPSHGGWAVDIHFFSHHILFLIRRNIRFGGTQASSSEGSLR
jgi:hypothetical protein